MALSPEHVALAHKLGNMTPTARGQAISAHMSNPKMAPHIAHIMSDPQGAMIASGAAAGAGGSGGAGPDQVGATDPSGAYNPNRAVSYSGRGNSQRKENIRHQILGFATASLASGGLNQKVVAKPQVNFKGVRLTVQPSVVAASCTIGSIAVGTTNQLAGNTLIPCDVFGPTSYAGDVDLSLCKAALDIAMLVNSGAAVQFNAGIVGLVQGKPIRPKHTKVQAFGLSPTNVPANSTVTITYNPQIDFVPRKVALTPGAGFSDSLIINNVQCGQMLQTASADPYPASMHTDLFPLDLDWDMITASVALQWTVTNLTANVAVFQGIVQGDVDPAQLAATATAYGV